MRLNKVIRIASRKSDLARIQAQTVGEALKHAHPQLEIEYQFRESLGDQNLQNPLWKMPEKGVFTEDFYLDLVEGKADLVVHSWKDLPVTEKPETFLAATMAREDARDLVLFKKSHRAVWGEAGKLRIFSSSPRRDHNLTPFLKTFLPNAPTEIEFFSVRGNIQTRVKKLLEDESIDALVVAKAALDRLLRSTKEEYAETRAFLKSALSVCDFLVAPLSQNPTAAAQGGLAIEVKRGRDDLVALLKSIHSPKTYLACEEERRILKKYGGGCHQKIGISVLPRPYGKIISIKGLTETGEKLDGFRLERDRNGRRVPWSRVFPSARQSRLFFDRSVRKVDLNELKDKLLLISRENALPREVSPKSHSLLWTAGLSTWKALAEAGYWVSGTLDGLGEDELPDLSALTSLPWLKLSHAETNAVEKMPVLATYDLVQKNSDGAAAPANFNGITHFYWMSASSFEEAKKKDPDLLKKRHFCGPGNTYHLLKKAYGDEIQIEIELSYGDFIQNWILTEENASSDGKSVKAGKKAAPPKKKPGRAKAPPKTDAEKAATKAKAAATRAASKARVQAGEK
jgi:hydroxymethylbilane synthase